MKLEKYLADYIEHETEEFYTPAFDLQEIIKQGLEAFESTENVIIGILDNENETKLEQ